MGAMIQSALAIRPRNRGQITVNKHTKTKEEAHASTVTATHTRRRLSPTSPANSSKTPHGDKVTDEQNALEFADKLYGSAMNVVGAATGRIDGNWKRDPKIIGLTILCRTLSTFKAALILVRASQVMEARMLARPLYENCLWIAALRERHGKFVEEMIEDDALNRKSLGQITVKLTAQHGGDMNNPGAMLLRQIIRELADTYKDPKKLHASDVAAMGVIGLYYVDYTRLSLDSLHCSVTALGRHHQERARFGKSNNGGRQR
jgi:hypothetical protein